MNMAWKGMLIAGALVVGAEAALGQSPGAEPISVCTELKLCQQKLATLAVAFAGARDQRDALARELANLRLEDYVAQQLAGQKEIKK